MTLIEKLLNGEVDLDELLECITSDDLHVALSAAASPCANEPILDIAAHDNDRQMRLAALNNPNIGDKTVAFLCDDKDIEVANKAMKLLKERAK